jgi:outer membrane lipoprotein-sorting protein
MKMRYLMLALLLSIGSLPGQSISAEEILNKVDANMISKSGKSTTRMVVHSRRASRTIESINYSLGDSKFYSEYTSPPRDKGTKMLKLDSDLWIFDPNTDRTIQISGNMLKQSVMGSDLSYEDFMEEGSLTEDYSAKIIESITHEGRACWVMELTALRDDVSYQKRRIYIDKERFVSLYEEWFAKSGKLLKTVSASEVKRISGRWYPTKILFKDELKQGQGTEYYIDSIEFDITIPPHTFSKAMLKK